MKLASLSSLLRHNGQEQPLELCSAAAAPNGTSATFDFHTVAWQADGFGFDATSGEFFTASPTALIVMHAMSEGMPREQILDHLSAVFEVAHSTAERDLECFFAELVHLGLTEESI